MGWLSGLLGGGTQSEAQNAKAAAYRMAAWEVGLKRGPLPDFVISRLKDSVAGRAPWMSTMTPAELLLSKSHGLRPIATVSGTCWYQFDLSWTDGHPQGWSIAIQRMVEEAQACDANAVVDVKMRTTGQSHASNMDFTLFGTAVRFDQLPATPDPLVVTTSAMEFVKLLEMNIVPTGIAIGASHNAITDSSRSYGGTLTFTNGSLNTLSQFREQLQRSAYYNLKRSAAYQGNGVLAHTQFSQFVKLEDGDRAPPRYFGRYIVLGTVVDTPSNAKVPHSVRHVVDMRGEISPLDQTSRSGHSVYGIQEREGAI